MAKKISVRLSNKLSGMLRAAVADMQAASADPRYELDMFDWHIPMVDGKCHVCMAGAVLAMRGNANPKYSIRPWHVDDITRRTGDKMRAINEMREGNFRGAFRANEGDEVRRELTTRECDAMYKAKVAVHEDFDYTAGRATSEAYLKAADILAGAGL